MEFDEIQLDELFSFKRKLDSFLEAYQTAEWAYCENEADYAYIDELARERAQELWQQLKGLAIALGIHADFLAEYQESLQKHGLTLAVA